MQTTKLYAQRVVDTATLPTRAHATDAGFDLYACIRKSPDEPAEIVIEPGKWAKISAGVKIAVPPGYYGRIADRSGNAVKRGLHVLAGVIDRGYRGEVIVALINLSDEQQVIKHGDRHAQLLITKIYEGGVEEVDDIDSLGDTERGAGGFGSTGQ